MAAISSRQRCRPSPTRSAIRRGRRVYLLVREHSAGAEAADAVGLTAGFVADEIGVHPNVARHHLDKLAAGGYIEVTTAKLARDGDCRPPLQALPAVAANDGGPGDLHDVPVHGDDLVLALLGRALDSLPPATAETIAEEVGAEYGRAMATALTGDALANTHRSLRSAMQAVASALTAHGFAAHTESRNDRLRIINDHCPFGDVATDHPVICAVDRGMVRGMLDQLYDAGDVEVATEASKAHGDTFCSTTL